MTSQQSKANPPYSEFWTPLHEAVIANKTKRVQTLIDDGADIEALTRDQSRPLHIAAHYGCCKIANILLNAGAQIEVVAETGRTPLHIAALTGHPLIIRALLAAGANVNARDNNDSTPLHLACKGKVEEAVAMALLQYNADTTLKDCTGRVPDCCERYSTHG